MPVQHISVNDLRPGMYIVDTGASWIDHPYLYAKEGLIRSQTEVTEIIHQGYAEAYYDPEQSNIAPVEPISVDNADASRGAPAVVSLQRNSIRPKAPILPAYSMPKTSCWKHVMALWI